MTDWFTFLVPPLLVLPQLVRLQHNPFHHLHLIPLDTHQRTDSSHGQRMASPQGTLSAPRLVNNLMRLMLLTGAVFVFSGC
jgi:hypothetical protein